MSCSACLQAHLHIYFSPSPPLLLTVPPDRATNLQIIPDSETTQSLGISWTNPDFTGFSEISIYRLFIFSSKNQVGFNQTFAGTAGMMDYTIESLSPLTEYTIELFVRNVAGLEGVGVTTTGMTLSLSETHRLTHTYTYMQTHKHTYHTYTQTHKHTHTQTHKHTQTYTHRNIHTCIGVMAML